MIYIKPISNDRLLHMIGVAEYMYENAARYGINEEIAYLIGLLHDIGYISGSKDSHEKYGAELLQKLGINHIMYDVILNHGKTPKEFLEQYSTIPYIMVLMWEADLKVDLTGKNVGYTKRLEDIANRHGYDSKPYKICKETIDWLKGREI